MVTVAVEELREMLARKKSKGNNGVQNNKHPDEVTPVEIKEPIVDITIAVGDRVTVSYDDTTQSKNLQGEYPSVTATYRIEESQPRVATKKPAIIETRPTKDYLEISSILDTSSLGRALLGKKVGDEVSVTVGGETTKYTIINIEKAPLPPASN